MTVLVTLTIAGVNTDLFLLYSNVDNYQTAFESDISRAELLAGYSCNSVPDGTTVIKVVSTGACTNSVSILIDPAAGSTTTTTSTAIPVCSAFSELLSWNTKSIFACDGALIGQYYGNDIDFAAATTISINSGCDAASAGYYSNGTIWKYTADGINFISSGYCTITTTTTIPPSAMSLSMSSIVFDANGFTCNGSDDNFDVTANAAWYATVSGGGGEISVSTGVAGVTNIVITAIPSLGSSTLVRFYWTDTQLSTGEFFTIERLSAGMFCEQ